ncbi:ATPase [Erythrobacter citreus]|jgi:chromosomal replication initiation ATPase DnaA|uniref:ATPase n=1 Tax=Qipengyuania citrea TaxID=225971 RepID=A0A6I4U847_9SPHN|nr:ATPase [Qipengyuania citrea]MBB12460.1 ATPase [Sphingomonadaceae bacterium]HBC14550.1 ATPase [Erythrobacter sp.]MDP7325366.1 ATPase [Qipengyuania citrea]MDQ0565702.1 chromosomal replication initiation ATPase DnaA [Qipengyuania citrea]MXP35291.1 ATPase [Qipengyuania citrea]|tara:strand:- start:2322 stop:2936 length:615 start_codon:yes stop_codon:yes gene_type:complete
MTSQIALPLIPAGAGEPSSIVIGSGNRAVAEALAAPASWPFRTAILHGPPRAGKSLFARWFAAQQAGEAIDDAETLDETAIFHRWNRAQESGIPLLLVVGGGGWDIALPDLRSRMGAALQLEIGPPDDALATDLMLSHAAQRGLVLGEGAPAYLVPRMERSYAAIEKIVGEIDRLSLERQVPATLSVWRDALEAVQGPDQGRLL